MSQKWAPKWLKNLPKLYQNQFPNALFVATFLASILDQTWIPKLTPKSRRTPSKKIRFFFGGRFSPFSLDPTFGSFLAPPRLHVGVIWATFWSPKAPFWGHLGHLLAPKGSSLGLHGSFVSVRLILFSHIAPTPTPNVCPFCHVLNMFLRPLRPQFVFHYRLFRPKNKTNVKHTGPRDAFFQPLLYMHTHTHIYIYTHVYMHMKQIICII